MRHPRSARPDPQSSADAGWPSLASRWAPYHPAERSAGPPAGLTVRRAGPADCAAIAAIETSRDGSDASAARGHGAAQVAEPETLLLVALVDDAVVGFARAGRLPPPADGPVDGMPDGWYLLGIVVIDAWRRRGVGRALTRPADRLDRRASRRCVLLRQLSQPGVGAV